MKVTNTTPKPPEFFHPVTLSITFESEDELKELWSRLNPSWSRFVEQLGEDCFNDDDPIEGGVYPLWDHINNILTHDPLDEDNDF